MRPSGGIARHRDDLARRHHGGPRRGPVCHGLRAPDAGRERAPNHGGRPQQDRRREELEPRDRLDTPRSEPGNRAPPTHRSRGQTAVYKTFSTLNWPADGAVDFGTGTAIVAGDRVLVDAVRYPIDYQVLISSTTILYSGTLR